MVRRPDSLQTAPHLHDRMWELDGFGDYMKHSFHFQFIVLRRGITFSQMVRNLELHSFCATQNVHRILGKNPFKDKIHTYFFSSIKHVFFSFFFLKWAAAFCRCSWSVKVVLSCLMLTMCFMTRDPVRTVVTSINSWIILENITITLLLYIHYIALTGSIT